jgi:hypothetical protein
MATMISSYPTQMYHQQLYNYPVLPSIYSSQPLQNNYYTPPPPPQPKQTTTVQYVDSSAPITRPRREPRVYRQVIVLPTPEPIYRQVRHRLPTPDRQVIQRTIIQKANGDVVVQQERSKTKPRSYSRSEPKTQTRASRSRQIHTD